MSWQSAPSAARSGRGNIGAVGGWLIGLLATIAVVDVWSTYAHMHRASFADNYQPFALPTADQLSPAEHVDSMVRAASGVFVLLTLAIGVLFLVWLYRATDRVRDVNPAALRYANGWAIGGWFIPVASLVIPKQMVDDAWRGAGGSGPVRPRVPWWVHVWWTLWVLTNVFYVVARFEYSPGDGLDALARADRTYAFAHLLNLAAAGFAIAVVAGLCRRVSLLPAHTDPSTWHPQAAALYAAAPVHLSPPPPPPTAPPPPPDAPA